MSATESVISLEVIPERVANLESMLSQVAELVTLEAHDVQRFHRELGKRRRFENVPLRLNLSDEEVARFSVNQHRFPGFSVQARLARFYPSGIAGVHVIGYVGRTGLATAAHLHYEYRLNGVHRNPRTVKLPKAEPIKEEYKKKFLAQAQPLLEELLQYKRMQIASLSYD